MWDDAERLLNYFRVMLQM